MSMIFNVERSKFLTAVSSLQSITGKKGTIAILANILIETGNDVLFLTATDLEVGIRMEVKAEILSPGSVTIPARKLNEVVREIAEDNLHVEVSENKWIKINTKSGQYNLAGSDSEEYPSFPEFDDDSLSIVSAELLKENIEKTVFSIANENDNLFNLTGVLIEKEERDGKNYLRFVSSDGHRLTIMERETETDISKLQLEKTTLVPRKGILEINKFCENNEFIEVGFDNKQVVFKSDNALMIIRLMNGDFPDYKNIINSINKDSFIEIERKNFISCLKRINIFTEDVFNSVQFSFIEGKLILTSQNMDIGSGKEEVEIVYQGETMNLGFNGKYFVEALQVMNSNTIKAYLNSDKSPCLVEGSEDPGFMSIIMPMRI